MGRLWKNQGFLGRFLAGMLLVAAFSLKIYDFEMSTSRADQDVFHSVALTGLWEKSGTRGSWQPPKTIN